MPLAMTFSAQDNQILGVVVSQPAARLQVMVALLSRTDGNHERAKALFRSCVPPFRTCEAVLVEASYLLSKDNPIGSADIVSNYPIT